jgi:hypothetical protein
VQIGKPHSGRGHFGLQRNCGRIRGTLALQHFTDGPLVGYHRRVVARAARTETRFLRSFE